MSCDFLRRGWRCFALGFAMVCDDLRRCLQFRNVKHFVSVVVLLVCGWGFASGFAVVWRWVGEVRKSNFGMRNILLALLCGLGFASGFAIGLRCFVFSTNVFQCFTSVFATFAMFCDVL